MSRLLIFVLLVMMAHIGLGQTRTIYIKLDESSVLSPPATKSVPRISKSQIESIQTVKNVKSISSKSQSTGNARVIQQEESKYLKGIYTIEVSEGDEEALIHTMRQYENVVEVELEPEMEMLLVPNDAFISNQNYLSVIQAYEAWDITKGSSSIVVGVSDTGFELDHDDLIGKSFLNEADPIDGIDNDANGYIDDYNGWDFGSDDNDPTYEKNNDTHGHGTNVTGVIAANTNNSIGIAGLAYNSQFMPLKIFTENGTVVNGYSSIIYAADMGCDVINLSWGGTSTPSSILQSVINYAVLEKDMVVVAAAGNTEADLDFYPASYDHVLSVGNVETNDHKANNATWSYKVDVMAPGVSIYSTDINNAYRSNNGSSFSSPIVAATAALVRSVYPEYSAIQVMEHVRMTTDDIYSVGNNMDYYGQLGKGRVNVLRAVSEQNVGAISMYETLISSSFEDYIFPKDTIDITISIVNILRDLVGAKITLESESSFLRLITNEAILGDLYSFDSLQNITFRGVVSQDAPADEPVNIRLNYTDTKGYEDFEYIQLQTASDFFTLDNGVIRTTLSSDGNIGYADDSLKNGVGFYYGGDAYALQVGLMIGTHQDSIYDNIFNDRVNGVRDSDFAAVKNIAFSKREDVDIYARGVLRDTLFDSGPELYVEQEFLLWEYGELQDVLIQEYFVSNVGEQSLENLKVGYFLDLNIGVLADDFVAWDATNDFGYFYDTESLLFAGIAIISGHQGVMNAIDVSDPMGNEIDLPEIIDEVDKYAMLNTEKTTAGDIEGQNVAQLMVTNIASLGVGQSEKIAFTTVFGQSLTEIQSRLAAAQTAYDGFVLQPDLNLSQFTCENQTVELENDYSISLYEDAQGTIPIASGTDLSVSNVEKDSVLYYTAHQNGYDSDIYQLFIGVSNPIVEFRADPAILYLGDDEDNAVHFIDQSLGANDWTWSFSNGYLSRSKNPYTFFDEEGSYDISLDIVTDLGCEASGEVSFSVFERGTIPVLETNHEICAGEQVTILSSTSDQLRFYYHDYEDVPFYEGAALELASVVTDVVYYVSSTAEAVESAKTAVHINVDPVTAQFNYAPDTTDLSSVEMISLTDESMFAHTITWEIDDIMAGHESNLVKEVSSVDQLKVKLIVTSEKGCVSDSVTTVAFSQSTKAGVNENTERNVCDWGLVESHPLHGEVFAFFADAELMQLIAKGSHAMLGPIRSDTSFYIVNISDYHMSEATELTIDLIAFNSELFVTPDSLLAGSNPVVMVEAAPQDEIANYRWYLNEELKEISPSVNFLLYDEGNYEIKAILESETGCYDTLNYRYQVYLPLSSDAKINHDIVLYPNPIDSEDHLMITASHTISLVNIYDQLGTLVMSCQGTENRLEISAVELPSGVYIVQIISEEQVEFIKVVKR